MCTRSCGVYRKLYSHRPTTLATPFLWFHQELEDIVRKMNGLYCTAVQKRQQKLEKRRRFNLRPLNLYRFEEELKIIWEIYNSAWEKNWGFVHMNFKEFKTYVRKQDLMVKICFSERSEAEGRAESRELG